jgi:hypothetical protein
MQNEPKSLHTDIISMPDANAGWLRPRVKEESF